MLCDYFDKVLYISLPQAPNRTRNIIHQFEHSVLQHCLCKFDAVDGKRIDLRLVDSKIVGQQGLNDISEGKTKRFGVTLSYGALGCAWSHYLIYQECQYGNRPYFIVEDDITLIEDFDIELDKIMCRASNMDFDIIYLGLHNIAHLDKNTIIDDMFYKPKGLSCGTFGMIVSNTGAEKLLKTIFPINIQIDSVISNNKHRLNVYATKKELVKHTQAFGTNIQQAHGFKNTLKDKLNGSI